MLNRITELRTVMLLGPSLSASPSRTSFLTFALPRVPLRLETKRCCIANLNFITTTTCPAHCGIIFISLFIIFEDLYFIRISEKRGLRIGGLPPAGGRSGGLRNYLTYHFPCYIRQAEWPSLEWIRKLFMIKS